mmetsp:Transcript_12394/g.29151  ORF Transcript_12394/g.29151 Transcript_12394/m.29151 type:complete len:215 (+) Transcript_12394:309-953(+)
MVRRKGLPARPRRRRLRAGKARVPTRCFACSPSGLGPGTAPPPPSPRRSQPGGPPGKRAGKRPPGGRRLLRLAAVGAELWRSRRTDGRAASRTRARASTWRAWPGGCPTASGSRPRRRARACSASRPRARSPCRTSMPRPSPRPPRTRARKARKRKAEPPPAVRRVWGGIPTRRRICSTPGAAPLSKGRPSTRAPSARPTAPTRTAPTAGTRTW